VTASVAATPGAPALTDAHIASAAMAGPPVAAASVAAMGSISITAVGNHNTRYARVYPVPAGQCFGPRSGSELDPDSTRLADSDPYTESGSGKTKMTHKNKKMKFHVLKCRMFSFEG
jgi:hypothetical protein